MSKHESTFGTPSTVASNELHLTSPTLKEDASTVARAQIEHNGLHMTATPSAKSNVRMSIQTPPSPDESMIAETPPTPHSVQINTQTPPTGYAEECDTTARCEIKSQQSEFGTPMSDDEAEFGTPPSRQDATKHENYESAVYKVASTAIQSASSSQNNSKKKTQMYLDLGQKSFASHKICPTCSSLIVHGTAEDQQNHIQICKSYKEGVTCLGFRKERCVGRFGDERIVEVRDGDDTGKKKVKEVKQIVDGELGFAASSKHTGQEDVLAGVTSYLYIAKKRIVGLLLVKRVNRAYELIHEKSDGKTSSISRGTKPHPAIMGVHQIWVHNLHRHKGIATKLLECARGSFTFGMVIPVEKVAFSSPTEDGVGLAKQFVGEDGKVLVYDIC